MSDGPKKTPVLAQGSRVAIWKSNEDPLTDFLTRTALAAMTCGFDLISEKGFQYSISGEAETEEEIEQSRSVTWIWDLRKTATFNLADGPQVVSVNEFREHFEDLQWCQDNPDHPISYMRYQLEKSRDGLAKIRAIEPALRFTRDDVTATVPASATEEEIDEYFDQFDESQKG